MARRRMAILDADHRVVETATDEEVHAFHRVSENSIVADTPIDATTRVSTVFLGLAHGWHHDMWFETMIFRDEDGGEEERYATWDEAKAGHERRVADLRKTQDDEEAARPKSPNAWNKLDSLDD